MATLATIKTRKRLKGFVAEAAGRARGSSHMRSARAVVLIQGMIIGRGMTTGFSPRQPVGGLGHAMPVIRVAFKKALALSVE